MSGFRNGATGSTSTTANQGTPNTLANAWPVEVTDGTNVLGTTAHPLVVTGTTGTVSSGNSTTTPLAGGASFTGTSTSVLGYSVVELVVYADQASAAAGVLIEFSTDGTNWDDSSTFTFAPGSAGPNQGQSFIAGVRGQFMRVVYTNGATPQATFRLQTVLKTNIIGGDVVSINGTVLANQHGLLTVSQIVGLTTGGGGGYVPVKVNPSGTLTADVSNSTNVGVTGTVTANQGTAAALASGWPVKVTDGTNTQPTGDVPARSIDVSVTDGTNVLGTSAHPVRVDPTGTTAQPVTVNAGTNLIGQVSASAETSTVYSGTTALTPSFATISTSASGASSLVAAVASKHIRVLALYIVANGAVNVKFQSHTTPTDLTGLAYLAANGGFVLPFNPAGWFQSLSGEQLDINLSGAVAVGGSLLYVAV